MSDEIIEELWGIKDSIAREHGYGLRKLAAYLRSLTRWESPSESPNRSAYQIISEGSGQRLSEIGTIPQLDHHYYEGD